MLCPNEIERKILFITGICFSYWGKTIKIEGIRDPFEKIQYVVTFTNCKLIQWESVEGEQNELSSSVADVIGWEIGEGDNRKPAIITTNFFEMIIRYERYKITKQS